MLNGNPDVNINPPKIDVSKVDINVPGLDIHGPKIEIPQINVSMTKTDIHGNLPIIGELLIQILILILMHLKYIFLKLILMFPYRYSWI